jgi:hypothetical protein
MKTSGAEEDLDMNPHSYAHLIFDKGAKNIRWKIDSLFNKCCWEKWIAACRKLKLDPCLSPCTSINLKWIEDLNIRSKTLKVVQERTGNILEAIGFQSNDSPTKRKDQQMGLHEIKMLLHNKRNGLYIEEATHRMGEKLYQLNIWQGIDNQNVSSKN